MRNAMEERVAACGDAILEEYSVLRTDSEVDGVVMMRLMGTWLDES